MKIVILSGAGISAPSGVATFRDANGLWSGHRVEEVASPEGWRANPSLVLDFYNARRTQLNEVKPNAAHLAIAKWQTRHEVRVVTQNVDDLHERAGSLTVRHLHGRLTEARSSTHSPAYIMDIGYKPIHLGDKCPKGSQLRPNIVWFGEDVPEIIPAAQDVEWADVVIVVGTSLQVYPAAGLTEYARPGAHCVLVDVNPGKVPPGFKVVTASADQGIPRLTAWLDTLQPLT